MILFSICSDSQYRTFIASDSSHYDELIVHDGVSIIHAHRFETALAIDPKYEAAWTSKGTALSALGRNDEALACYDRALEINPRDARVWSNKSVALLNVGRREEALACYDRVLEIDSRNTDVGSGLL